MDRLSDPACRLGSDLRQDLAVLFGAHGLTADQRLKPWRIATVDRHAAAVSGVSQIRKTRFDRTGKGTRECLSSRHPTT